MKKFRSHMIGIDQGDLVMFSDFESDGPMWADTGPREVRKAISFSQEYTSEPAIQVGLTMWDLDQKTNPRSDIKAENITTTGFDLVFRTWSDTRVARVRANWMSVGEVPNDDDWELY